MKLRAIKSEVTFSPMRANTGRAERTQEVAPCQSLAYQLRSAPRRIHTITHVVCITTISCAATSKLGRHPAHRENDDFAKWPPFRSGDDGHEANLPMHLMRLSRNLLGQGPGSNLQGSWQQPSQLQLSERFFKSIRACTQRVDAFGLPMTGGVSRTGSLSLHFWR